VLLPSDIQRKPFTSFTAVLLPFVTYLLTLPRNYRDIPRHVFSSVCKASLTIKNTCQGYIRFPARSTKVFHESRIAAIDWHCHNKKVSNLVLIEEAETALK
jgi:hypothetical protein